MIAKHLKNNNYDLINLIVILFTILNNNQIKYDIEKSLCLIYIKLLMTNLIPIKRVSSFKQFK